MNIVIVKVISRIIVGPNIPISVRTEQDPTRIATKLNALIEIKLTNHAFVAIIAAKSVIQLRNVIKNRMTKNAPRKTKNPIRGTRTRTERTQYQSAWFAQSKPRTKRPHRQHPIKRELIHTHSRDRITPIN